MEEKSGAGERVPTRRDFLKGTAYGTLGVALGLRGLEDLAETPGKAIPFAAGNPLSNVVLIRNEAAVDADHKVNAEVVAEMIGTAVRAFDGEEEAVKAWRRYIRPEDTVGVKFTHCGWMRVPTEQAMIDAVTAALSDVGVPKERIHIKDYDMSLEQCTALVNVPSVKVHSLTGLAVSLKNYINFTGKERSYHFDGSVKLGEAWLMPEVKGKTRLILVDALRPYFGPGPQINPLHRWDYKGILVGTDPVAIDTVCLRICQEKRNLFKGEEWPINPPPKSIAMADTKYHLGTSDASKIGLTRLGWKEAILI